MFLLVMGMTGAFAQTAAEKAVETLLRDVDEMVVKTSGWAVMSNAM